MSEARCMGEPISWLELERHALGESSQSQTLEAHLDACPACSAVWQLIQQDERRMPALVVPAAARGAAPSSSRWRWWLALTPALAALVALLLVVAKDEGGVARRGGTKGGDASFVLLREHDGQLLEPTSFSPDDRFKVLVSCRLGERFVDVVVKQGIEQFYPLPVARLACGNHVPVPGAFSLDGGTAQVCVRISREVPARHERVDGEMCQGLPPQ